MQTSGKLNSNFKDDDFKFEIYEKIIKKNNIVISSKKIINIANFPKNMFISDIRFNKHNCYLSNGIIQIIKEYLKLFDIDVRCEFNWSKFCGEPYQHLMYYEDVKVPDNFTNFKSSFLQYCINNNIDLNEFCDYESESDCESGSGYEYEEEEEEEANKKEEDEDNNHMKKQKLE